MTERTPTRLASEFANAIAVALAAYGPAGRLALEVAGGQDDRERLDALDLVGRTVGLELTGYLRAVDLERATLRGSDDPAPVLDLARVLAESLSLLVLVSDAQTAGRLPLAPPERIDAAYDAAARAWMSQYLEQIPVRADAEDTP